MLPEEIPQWKKDYYEAIHEVAKELMAMPQEEFDKMLAEHEMGDIGQFLLETGAINLIMGDIKNKQKEMENNKQKGEENG
jgi:hypothetical protein